MPKILKLMMAFIFFTFMFWRCTYEGYNPSLAKRFINQVEKAVDSLKKSSAQNYLKINEITDFSWGKMYIFPPYTTLDTIEKALGFKWNYLERGRQENYDDYDLIVFTKSKQVRLYILFPKGIIEFDETANSNGFYGLIPEKAKFSIIKRLDSGVYLEIFEK